MGASGGDHLVTPPLRVHDATCDKNMHNESCLHGEVQIHEVSHKARPSRSWGNLLLMGWMTV